jgi:predicted nucleic acid-binding protein
MSSRRLVLDTSAYSGFNRSDKRLKEIFRPENEIFVSPIFLGELRAGLSVGTNSKENKFLRQKFLDSSNVSMITLTDNTTRLFANNTRFRF